MLFQMSFAIKKRLDALAFEPMNVKGLEPDASVECAISLNTGAIAGGVYAEIIPIKIKNGASVAVHVQAHVIEPRLALSTDLLKFGNVHMGQAKVDCRLWCCL